MDSITAHDPADYYDYEGPRELTPEEAREAEIGQLRDEAGLARRKASAIQRLLNGTPLSQLSVPTERLLVEWHVASLLDEAKRAENRAGELERPAASRASSLKAEWKTLQATWMLQHRGLEAITARQSEIEEELTSIESEREVA